MTAREILEVARARLVLWFPFFGTLAIYLKLEESEAVPTCGTDGQRLFYNPGWAEEVKENEGIEAIMGTVCHEVLHAALGHIWRRGSREPLLWNIATDLAVNPIVLEARPSHGSAKMKLPSGVLLDDKFKDMPAEEIYARLIKEVKKVVVQAWGDHSMWEKGNSTGFGGFDNEAGDGKSGNMESGEAAAAEWAARVAAAAQQAGKQQGDLPAGIRRLVEEALRPRISWKEVLAEFLQRARTEYTYYPPDRRFVSDDIYIPDFGGFEIEDIVIAVDTSGSISEQELNEFAAECRAILALNYKSQVHLVSCDAAVHSWQTIDAGDEWPKFEFGGGGGTDFRPVFNEIEKRGIMPSVLVYLTDGYGTAPKEQPSYPVLWVITPDGKEPASWGRTIKMLN